MFKTIISAFMILLSSYSAFSQSESIASTLSADSKNLQPGNGTHDLVFSKFMPPQGDFENYGGPMSIGISILDGVGVPVRFYRGQHVFEGGFYIGGVAFYNDDLELEQLEAVPSLGAGYSYFGNRFLKEKKKFNKVRAHGVSVRFQQYLGEFQTSIPSVSWAMETFRENRTHRSFIFELGIRYAFPNFVYMGEEQPNQIGVHLRCHWNFFLNRK